MSPTPQSEANGRQRSRAGRRIIAGTVAAGLTIVGLAVVNTQSASAATAADGSSKPLAQSVGNFLDATLGGNTLDSIAKLKYATAKAPGTTSTQNPLDATVLNAINVPLTDALQLPKIAGITLGAVNQVAKAQVDGYSYGASGAVSNSGGVSVGGNNAAFPAGASIKLCAAALSGGDCKNDQLGTVSLDIGAVSALAQTPVGVDKGSSASYNIAGLDLALSSPLVGKLLGPVGDAVGGLIGALATGASGLGLSLPSNCPLTSGKLPNLYLEPVDPKSTDPSNYAITIISSGPDAGTITISLDKLLQVLKLDLNHLAPNTDLIGLLLSYLTSAKGLAAGLTDAVTGLTNSLQDDLSSCAPAPLDTLLTSLSSLQGTLTSTLSGLVGSIAGAAGANPLAPVESLLENLVDIGVNVQPNGPKGTYTDHLAATPKQGTAVVPGQTVVRAIEVNIAAGGGATLPALGSLPSIPGLLTAPSNTGIATLALANAAAGPSSAAAAPTTPAGPTTTAPPANPSAVPTGVPAGMGTTGGTPVLPIVLLIVGLLVAGGGVAAFKFRGRHVI